MSRNRKMVAKEALIIGMLLAAAAVALLLAFTLGRGHSPSSASVSQVKSPSSTTKQAETNPTGVSSAEPLAAGDIPDNAVFVSYSSTGGGYSLQYIEGWVVTQQPDGGVIINDKDSSVNVHLVDLPLNSMSMYVQQIDLPKLRSTVESFQLRNTGSVTVNGTSVVKLTYTGFSKPDPVTGKKRNVMNDRYYLVGHAKLAILTLTTPVGVDNVDAFNQIVHSFSWR